MANPVDGSIQIAEALKAAGYTPLQIASAIVSPDVYPMLTALQLGVVLLDPEVFPLLTRNDLTASLVATDKYSLQEIAAAVADLFAKAKPIGPVGGGGNYFRPPEIFDDLQFAIGIGQPITAVNLRAGDILDSIQAIYGGGIAGPQHGGNGGIPQTVAFNSGDLLGKVSGQFGNWFQSIYILQIAFTTKSGKMYGPFPSSPTSGGQPFLFEAIATDQIIAFFGQVAMATRFDSPPSQMVIELGVYTKSY